jgi:hypothetical protein
MHAHLAGYAVECGLKACIMVHVDASGAIFLDKKFSEKCWTHDLEDLLALANLTATLGADAAANAALAANWFRAKVWSESSRYLQKTQPEAQGMYDAVANNPGGVGPAARDRCLAIRCWRSCIRRIAACLDASPQFKSRPMVCRSPWPGPGRGRGTGKPTLAAGRRARFPAPGPRGPPRSKSFST